MDKNVGDGMSTTRIEVMGMGTIYNANLWGM